MMNVFLQKAVRLTVPQGGGERGATFTDGLFQLKKSRPGLKMGVENGIFWSEIGSGFGERGGTPLPRIPRSTPRENNGSP